MRVANIKDAAVLIARYGNVSNDAEELLKTPPSESQLSAAESACFAEVDLSFRLLRQHYRALKERAEYRAESE